jgi:hypothetical protein
MFDDYFKNINRSAIVLMPKQPFFKWLQQHDPAMNMHHELLEGDVYLLPDFETKEQVEKWLQKNYNELFEEQLHNWYTDEDMWPQKRSFQLFQEWFSYSIHTMLFDTQKGMIEKL